MQTSEESSQKWHSKYHWWCCIRPVLGMILWVLAIISLIMAWMVLRQQTPLLGYNDIGWYLNAIVFALLAIPLKAGKGWHMCHRCHGEHCDHHEHHQ